MSNTVKNGICMHNKRKVNMYDTINLNRNVCTERERERASEMYERWRRIWRIRKNKTNKVNDQLNDYVCTRKWVAWFACCCCTIPMELLHKVSFSFFLCKHTLCIIHIQIGCHSFEFHMWLLNSRIPLCCVRISIHELKCSWRKEWNEKKTTATRSVYASKKC